MRCNKKRNSLSIRVSISIKIFQRTFGETIEIFVKSFVCLVVANFFTTNGHKGKHKGAQREK